MATGWPMKVSYANGDVYSASDVNDTNGTINLLGASVAYAAGKNKIINGDFRVNQRSFTSNTTGGSFNFDRWLQVNSGTTGTLTTTPQTFTPGAAPIAGYEGSTFIQGITAAGVSADTLALFQQRIEDVRTFAGQTVTFSFFAKATSGTPKIGLEMAQNFGTGGSPSATVQTSLGAVTISTSWARYSLSVTVPSISGKTIGTTANSSYLTASIWLSAGSDYAARASSIGLQNNTFQIWGVQVEAGSTATAFQTATGTIQGELAACQRYYIKFNDSTNAVLANGNARSTTGTNLLCNLPTSMRVRPTSLDFTSLQISDGVSNYAVTSLTSGLGTQSQQYLDAGVASGLTQFRPMYLQQNGSTGYVAFSAEL